MSKDKKQNQTGIDEFGNAAEAGVDAAGTNFAEALKDNTTAESENKKPEDLQKELENIKSNLDEKSKQCAEYIDKLQRTAAEFDNYKKRSAKEKEALYIDAVGDVVGTFLPVMDNLERALSVMPSDTSAQGLKEGVEMVLKQFREAFKNLGVEEIKAVNEQFDPMLHNAVMHVEDEALGHNVVVDEFQKGYMYKEKVIRYSMVKVAN